MSTLRVDNIKSRTGTAVTIPSGQSLDVTGELNVTGSSNFNTTGIITASQFMTTAGVGITENIVAGVITATSFVGNVTGNASGTAGGLTGTPDITVQNITGVAATFTGVLTYEDVTNVDSVGIVTGRGGLEVGAAGVGGTVSALGHVEFVGVTTIGLGLTFADDIEARFGNAGDLRIYHDGTDSYIHNNTGNLQLTCNEFRVKAASGGEALIGASDEGEVQLYMDGSKKLNTVSTGIIVTGIASVTGVATCGGVTVGVGTTASIFSVQDGATQNRFSGILVEQASIQATNVTSGSIDLAQGNVHYFTSNGSGATTAAIKYKGGNNLSSYMKVGENISISIISKPNNSEYINAVTVDGAAVTEEWVGGTPSSASGAASTVTITTINLTRIASTGTANSDYLVLCQATNFE